MKLRTLAGNVAHPPPLPHRMKALMGGLLLALLYLWQPQAAHAYTGSPDCWTLTPLPDNLRTAHVDATCLGMSGTEFLNIYLPGSGQGPTQITGDGYVSVPDGGSYPVGWEIWSDQGTFVYNGTADSPPRTFDAGPTDAELAAATTTTTVTPTTTTAPSGYDAMRARAVHDVSDNALPLAGAAVLGGAGLQLLVRFLRRGVRAS